MWHRRQSEASHGPWSQWSPLGQPDGEYYGPITVGAHADGRLVLAVGMHVPDDIPASQVKPVSLLEQTTPSGGWSQWRSFHTPGPHETTDPVLALDADQRLQVWMRIPGTTNLFMLRQNRPNGDEWHGGETEIKPSPEPSERWPPSDPPH